MSQRIRIGGTPYSIGKKYLFRTVTMYWAGVLDGMYDNELVLKNARFIKWMASFKEIQSEAKVESYEIVDGEVIINRQSIVDVVELSKLPGED